MFSINGLISEGANTEPNDVLKTKTALAQTGHYKVPSHGIVPFPDRQMIDGLKNFQRDNGLTVDGVMRPKGPTETKIKEKISEQEQKDRAAIERQRAYERQVTPPNPPRLLPIEPQPILNPMPTQPIHPPLIPTPLPPNLGPAPIQPPIRPVPGYPIIGRPIVEKSNIGNTFNHDLRLHQTNSRERNINNYPTNNHTKIAGGPADPEGSCDQKKAEYDARQDEYDALINAYNTIDWAISDEYNKLEQLRQKDISYYDVNCYENVKDFTKKIRKIFRRVGRHGKAAAKLVELSAEIVSLTVCYDKEASSRRKNMISDLENHISTLENERDIIESDKNNAEAALHDAENTYNSCVTNL